MSECISCGEEICVCEDICSSCGEENLYCLCHWYYTQGIYTKEEWKEIMINDDWNYVCIDSYFIRSNGGKEDAGT